MYKLRLAIEEWLWSGGRLRTWLAKMVPLYFSDVDCADYSCDCSIHDITTPGAAHADDCPKYD